MIGEAMGGLTDPTDIVQQFLSNESNLFDHFRDCERVYETIKNNKNEVRHIKEKYNQMNSQATKANAAAQEKMGQLQRRIDQTRDKDKIQKRSLRKIKKNFDSIATRMVSATSSCRQECQQDWWWSHDIDLVFFCFSFSFLFFRFSCPV